MVGYASSDFYFQIVALKIMFFTSFCDNSGVSFSTCNWLLPVLYLSISI